MAQILQVRIPDRHASAPRSVDHHRARHNLHERKCAHVLEVLIASRPVVQVVKVPGGFDVAGSPRAVANVWALLLESDIPGVELAFVTGVKPAQPVRRVSVVWPDFSGDDIAFHERFFNSESDYAKWAARSGAEDYRATGAFTVMLVD